MTKEQIKRVASEAALRMKFRSDIHPSQQGEALFIDGAQWRINSVWHDISERPKFPGKVECVKFLLLRKNGEYDQYVQHNAENIKRRWRDFCNIVAEAIPSYDKMARECGNGTRHRSHIGRIISDYNIKCLCDLYFRFECIDEQGREYQQPYFANGHQNEAIREVML